MSMFGGAGCNTVYDSCSSGAEAKPSIVPGGDLYVQSSCNDRAESGTDSSRVSDAFGGCMLMHSHTMDECGETQSGSRDMDTLVVTMLDHSWCYSDASDCVVVAASDGNSMVEITIRSGMYRSVLSPVDFALAMKVEWTCVLSSVSYMPKFNSIEGQNSMGELMFEGTAVVSSVQGAQWAPSSTGGDGTSVGMCDESAYSLRSFIRTANMIGGGDVATVVSARVHSQGSDSCESVVVVSCVGKVMAEHFGMNNFDSGASAYGRGRLKW